MLGIILCDDDRFLLKLESQKIQEEIVKNQLQARICCVTQDSNEMFRYLKQNPGVYLFFVDLDFGKGKLNGIDIARQLKLAEPASKIVFVTNHQEMAMQVLASGVEPFGFLEKSTDFYLLSRGYRKYIQMALSVVETQERCEREICLNIGLDEEICLRISQITYVEAEKSVSHGVSYHTLDGSKITLRDTMDHVLQLLGEDFARCHRSVVVNKQHVISLGDGTVRLSNAEEVPCSFRLRNEVKKWFSQ